MRVVHGFEAGKQALSRRVSWPWENPSQAMLDANVKLFGKSLTPEQAVMQILHDVKTGGDKAVQEYTKRLDGATTAASLEVPREMWREATKQLNPRLLDAMKFAAGRVQAYHEASMPRGWFDPKQGYGETFIPLHRAGLYVPGGTAAYPSTVIMTAIPARVAGVKEVIICSPAREGQWPHPSVLAAAELVGADRVFRVGGAQAIAAMAYGTESVPRVDIVCGPGNMFVTLAKKLVWGDVAVDGLFGPTETVLITDETPSAAFCAADLLAQAEHDVMASAILISTSERLVNEVQMELVKQLAKLPRSVIASKAIENNGVAVVVNTLDEAVELANLYAPEHLSIMTKQPWAIADKVRNAGAIFLGDETPEVIGDYTAGPSHVMPTGGTARFNSSLGVRQFLKSMVLIAQDETKLQSLANAAMNIAEGEGLHGHAAAARLRLDPENGKNHG